MERFFQAARQRGLDRVGAAYALTAWVVVQAASIALPAFDAPPWVMRWLIVVAFAGLPVALILAWHANEDKAEVLSTGWRRWVLPGILAVVFVATFAQLALHWSRAPGKPVAAIEARAGTLASVAVLPFANLSGDPAKRYFSDGIADQLITELSRRRNLRVAARTSSFAVGGRDIRTIGRMLGVGAVVEGSVREDKNRVRIVAELIDARDGFQIWSESYDRDLTNILTLQEDIARAIGQALSRKLTGRDEVADAAPKPRPKQPKIDPEAYREYLQGQFYFAQRSESGIERAVAMFEDVTRRAPDFADGFAALASARLTLALNFMHGAETVPATLAIDRALALDPENSVALMARVTKGIVEWKWRAAADDLLKVEARDSGTPGLWHMKGVFLSYMGLQRMALPAVEKAVRQDPLAYIDRHNLALYLGTLGRKEEALKVAREGLVIQPGNLEGQQLLCRIFAEKGDVQSAQGIKTQLSAMPSPEARLPAIACAYYVAVAQHDNKTVLALADAASADFPRNGIGAEDLAIAYAQAGEMAKAFGWLETAFETREPQIFALPYTNPELTMIYTDPRWKAYRSKPAFREWEAARLEIAKRFQIGE